MNFDIATLKARLLDRFRRNAATRKISSRTVDPVRDWKIVLLCASLLVLASGAAGLASHMGVFGPALEGPDVVVRRARLDQDALARTLEALDARADAHERARSASPAFVDPGR